MWHTRRPLAGRATDLDRYVATVCIVASVCGWRCVEENHHLHEDMKHEGSRYPTPTPSILSTSLVQLAALGTRAPNRASYSSEFNDLGARSMLSCEWSGLTDQEGGAGP